MTYGEVVFFACAGTVAVMLALTGLAWLGAWLYVRWEAGR